MEGIPPAKNGDAEDVVWALQTADTLWKRGDRVDAIVWVRRAAQSAGEADDDERAVTLARSAAELGEQLANEGSSAGEGRGPEQDSVRPAGAGNSQVDDLLRASSHDFAIDVVEEQTVKRAYERPDPAIYAAPAPRAPLNSDADYETVTSDYLVGTDEEPHESVPPAGLKHAGMLDPWSEGGPAPEVSSSARPQSSASIPIPGGAHRKSSPPPPPPPKLYEEDEVTTSARHVLLSPSGFPVSADPTTRPRGTEVVTQRPASLEPVAPVSAPEISSFEVVAPKPPAAPRAAPPLPPKRPAKPPLPPRALKAKQPEPAAPPAPPAAPAPSAPAAPPAAPPPPPSVRPASTRPVPSTNFEPVAGVDLTTVEAFADLPDDARGAFALAAKVSDLAKDEEVNQWALAYVIEGEVDATATMVDAPAVRFVAGSVLRSRGSIEDYLALRLICASDTASVAVWREDAVASAFKSCPWVEEDLRRAANRSQALAGVTVGPLGERLDRALRDQVTDRLDLRVLAPGEIIVEKGKALPGLVIVGVGGIELCDGDVVKETLGSGDFLFAEGILGGNKAPLTARAGKGGALTMWASRAIAQELLVTCPPLLELFAGM